MDFIITQKAKEELEKQYHNKYIRIKPKMRTWAGITYNMVQDEPKEKDNTYMVGHIKFVINKEVEKDVSHIEIDYEKGWWGEDFIITAGF